MLNSERDVQLIDPLHKYRFFLISYKSKTRATSSYRTFFCHTPGRKSLLPLKNSPYVLLLFLNKSSKIKEKSRILSKNTNILPNCSLENLEDFQHDVSPHIFWWVKEGINSICAICF